MNTSSSSFPVFVSFLAALLFACGGTRAGVDAGRVDDGGGGIDAAAIDAAADAGTLGDGGRDAAIVDAFVTPPDGGRCALDAGPTGGDCVLVCPSGASAR